MMHPDHEAMIRLGVMLGLALCAASFLAKMLRPAAHEFWLAMLF